jgi:hypothetical protein
MKVFRGPKQKPGYPRTDLVDVVDLGKDERAWTGEKYVEFMVSRESARTRRALGHILLSEDDVVALYAGLVKGWRKKLAAKPKSSED